MQGNLAEAYAKLVKELWESSSDTCVPRDFKWTIGRFAPQFSGFSQHDSQELLAFLLDGLHEDLNRIINKPYVEATESNGQPDEDVSLRAWNSHLLRNQSIIVDKFQGQFKSTLTCNICGKISVTFDPFMYLSLPLPIKDTRIIHVTVVFRDGAKTPVKYGVEVKKNAKIITLKLKLLELCKELKSANCMSIQEIHQHKLLKIYEDKNEVNEIHENDDIICYEILEPSPNVIYVSTVNRLMKPTSNSFSSYTTVTAHIFGRPLYLSLPAKVTYAELDQAIKESMKLYTHFDKVEQDEEMKDTNSKAEELYDDYDSDPNAPNAPLCVIRIIGHSMRAERLTEYQGTTKPLPFSVLNSISVTWHKDKLEKIYDANLAKNVLSHESLKKVSAVDDQSVPLSACFDLFTTTEQLGEDDLWYCPACAQHRQAYKKFDLYRMPEVLVIHLKRFSYSRIYRDKLDTLVDFPIKLDMSPWVKGPQKIPPVYDLYAVSNHYGGMGGGHYTAYAKNKEDNKWYTFDDSHVSSIPDPERVKTTAAYVLFYRKQSSTSSKNQNSDTKLSVKSKNEDTDMLDKFSSQS